MNYLLLTATPPRRPRVIESLRDIVWVHGLIIMERPDGPRLRLGHIYAATTALQLARIGHAVGDDVWLWIRLLEDQR